MWLHSSCSEKMPNGGPETHKHTSPKGIWCWENNGNTGWTRDEMKERERWREAFQAS